MRNHKIDAVKGYSIFLIVWSHLSLGVLLHDVVNTTILSLFFLISGYLYKELKLQELIQKLTTSLFCPFLLFSIVGYLYAYLYAQFVNHTDFRYAMLIKDAFMGTTYEANIPLWFLLSLFEVQIIYFFFSYYIKKQAILLLLCFVLLFIGGFFIQFSLNYLYIAKSLLYLFPFAMGVYYSQSKNEFGQKSDIIRTVLCLVSLLLLLMKLSLDESSVWGYSIGVVSAILALPFLLSKIYVNRLICWLGRNSLVILCFHIISNDIVWRFSYQFCVEINLFSTFFLALFSIVLCIPVVFFYNKYLRARN